MEDKKALNLDVIAGRQSVAELLRGRRKVEEVLLVRGLRPSGVVRAIEILAKDRGVKLKRVERDYLDALAGGVPHQGVVALAEPFLSTKICRKRSLRSQSAMRPASWRWME